MMLVSPDKLISGAARAARKRVCTAWKKLHAPHTHQAQNSGTHARCLICVRCNISSRLAMMLVSPDCSRPAQPGLQESGSVLPGRSCMHTMHVRHWIMAEWHRLRGRICRDMSLA